jgi:hypothetical protein
VRHQRGEGPLLEGGGTTVSEAKQLRELETENARLKKLLVDAELDKSSALKELLSRSISVEVHEALGVRTVMPPYSAFQLLELASLMPCDAECAAPPGTYSLFAPHGAASRKDSLRKPTALMF